MAYKVNIGSFDSVGQITASAGIMIADDQKIVLGANEDSTIEYDENGANAVRWTIPTAGLWLSGNVSFADGSFDVDIASHDTSNGLKLGGVLVSATAAELNKLDGYSGTTGELNYVDTGVSVGTVAASKAVVVDANKEITGFTAITASFFKGDGSQLTNLPAGGGSGSANIHADDFMVSEGVLRCSGSAIFGNAAADVVSVVGQMTASAGVLFTGPDIKFGNAAADVVSVVGQMTASAGVLFTGPDIKFGNAAADVVTLTAQVTASAGVKCSSTFEVAGAAEFDGDVELGNAGADTIDIKGQASASAGLSIKDDIKLGFGSNDDGQIWYDETGANIMRFAIPAGGLAMSGTVDMVESAIISQAKLRGASVSGDTTIADNNYYTIWVVNTSGGSHTITLPTAADNLGRVIIVKDGSGHAASNALTVDGESSETIDGQASITIDSAYGAVSLWCNGSAWLIW